LCIYLRGKNAIGNIPSIRRFKELMKNVITALDVG
jgi:hypothetical protein